MDTLLRANANELNSSLIDFIKATFKNKRIAVHIYEEEMDETDYLLSSETNKEKLLQAIEDVKSGRNTKVYTMEEINRFLNEPGNETDHSS